MVENNIFLPVYQYRRPVRRPMGRGGEGSGHGGLWRAHVGEGEEALIGREVVQYDPTVRQPDRRHIHRGRRLHRRDGRTPAASTPVRAVLRMCRVECIYVGLSRPSMLRLPPLQPLLLLLLMLLSPLLLQSVPSPATVGPGRLGAPAGEGVNTFLRPQVPQLQLAARPADHHLVTRTRYSCLYDMTRPLSRRGSQVLSHRRYHGLSMQGP